jgi:cullin-associated NEDD8-dissociated protein 1
LGRHAPTQIAPSMIVIVPSILDLSSRDDDELRESCLQVSSCRSHELFDAQHNTQTLEVLVLRCPTEMLQFIPGVITLGTQLIKYDPVSIPIHSLSLNVADSMFSVRLESYSRCRG